MPGTITTHDSAQCPGCMTPGDITEFKTSGSTDKDYGDGTGYVNGSADWDRVKWRNYECPECGTEWRDER